MFVCSHCGEVTTSLAVRRAANGKAWAIGRMQHNGFHVRRIVWGLLMAQAEKRMDEEIRAAVLMVESQHKRRQQIAPELTGGDHGKAKEQGLGHEGAKGEGKDEAVDREP